MPNEPQKGGKFSIEITKTETRKDLPTVDMNKERSESFGSGAGVGALVAALVALIVIAALVFALKN